MLPIHRQRIQESMRELIKLNNLRDVFEEVLRRGVSFPDMIDRLEVRSQNEEARKTKFFQHIQTRGPKAFDQLVQSLFATGNPDLALILDPNAMDERLIQNEMENMKIGYLHEDEETSIGYHTSPLKIVVKDAILYNNGNQPRSYQMLSNPRGFALIINIIDFDGSPHLYNQKKRHGAEHDSKNLRILLEAFGFHVTIETNTYKNDLLRRGGVLDNFIAQFSNGNVDCCFVCIMSHGDEDFWIEMKDQQTPMDYSANKVHLWNDIIRRFSNRNFPEFQGKPKIFMIQACRGLKQNLGLKLDGIIKRNRTESDSSVFSFPSTRRTIPEFNHIMILNSTIPGYESIRDKYRGSWFIECVCCVFMNHAWHMSLAEMSSLVAEKLENLETSNGVKQSSEFTTVGTFYNLYFNPGLISEEEGTSRFDII